MALKAGYYGIKKKMVNKLTKLTGIYSIGSGLNLSAGGSLSVKNATTSQKGIVQLDEVPTENSTNVSMSGGVYTALSAKQDTLTFDDTPTSASTNPVKSGGVYDAIQDVYEVNGVVGAKNLWSPYSITNDGYATYTETTNGLVVVVTSSLSYRHIDVTFINLPQNTDITFTTDVTVSSGAYGIGVSGSDDNSTYTSISTTGTDYVKTFNTGEYDYIRITLYCTRATVETGSVTYDNLMLRLATDTDSTYAPYAMTNRELTERFVKVPFTVPSTLDALTKLVDYPTGYSKSNSVLVSFALDNRMGEGLFSASYKRCFVSLADDEIQIYNSETNSVGKSGYVILGKL